MSKASRYSEDLTRSGGKLSVVGTLQESEIVETFEKTEQDDVAQELQKAMHRTISYSMFSLERKNAASDDPASMTIEFLRARLISERNVSKAAKQRTQLLAKKVIELQRKLEDEIAKRQKAEALARTALENVGQASATVMETSDASNVFSFRQMLSTNLSSQEYSPSCSSDNERDKGEIFEEKVISGGDEYSHKGKGPLPDEESTIREFAQEANYPYQDAYCYGPWSFVYSVNDETSFPDFGRNEKEHAATFSDHIPVVLNCDYQTDSRQANQRGISDSSNPRKEAFLPVSDIRSVPELPQDYVQEPELSSPIMFARQTPTFTEQKARDSTKDEDIGAATLCRTTRGGSSREDPRTMEYGCSPHPSSVFGSRSKVQTPFEQLCKKNQQENKGGMVESNLHSVPFKDAQTPGVMAASFRRKLEVFNPKQLINKGFRKGATTVSAHNANMRDPSMKEFNSNVQGLNHQANGRLFRPASDYILRPGVAQPVGRRKDLKHSSLKTKLYASDSLPTQNPESTVDPSGVSNCNDCNAHSMLQSSRNIIRTVPRRSDKYIQQQLECLEMSASANAADSQPFSSTFRRTQSFIDLPQCTPSFGADSTGTDVEICDSDDPMVYPIKNSLEQSNRKTLSEYLSLDMEGTKESSSLNVSEHIADTAKESIQKTDVIENKSEIRISIQERPNDSIARKENVLSVENFHSQQTTPTSDAQIAFPEHAHPVEESMNNFLCDARNSRDEEIARYIGSKDNLGGYCRSLQSNLNPSGGSSSLSHYMGSNIRDCSSFQEIEFAADNLMVKEVRPPHLYASNPEEMGCGIPSHYPVLQQKCSTRHWHDQEHSSMRQFPWCEGSRAQLISAARSTGSSYHPW